MKLKEVLQKVTENLNMEKDLKGRIKSAEKKVVWFEEKLADSKAKLENGYVTFEELKYQLLQDLTTKAETIPGNLDSYIILNDEEEIVASLDYSFMGNKYKLIDDQFILIAGKDGLQTSETIEEVYNKYLEEGKKLLNAESINKLQEIATLYAKNPKKVSAGFEKLKKEQIVKSFEDKLAKLRLNFDDNIAELEKVEDKIEKAKVFKSKLAKKLFDRRAKLEEKQNDLLDKTDNLGKSIKAIELELADKSQIDKDVEIYVGREFDSLHTVLDFVKGFEVAKYRLASHESRCIDFVKLEIEDLEKGLTGAEIKVEDLRTMLKSNRKVRKETISMAFKDKQFGAELDNANTDKIAKEDKEAYELLQAKYDQIIASQIKKII